MTKDVDKYEVILENFNRLYISYRRKYILQYRTKEGVVGYKTVPKEEDRKYPFYLTDAILGMHMTGNRTIGIFASTDSYKSVAKSKFICFDVDTGVDSERDTRNIVSILEDFNIRREDVHVSYSGSKGYHVEIFFDDLVELSSLEIFYRRVLKEGNFSPNEVELRPLGTMGVKLPLGIHQKTGKRCWYVDNQTFKHLRGNYTYLSDVNPISGELFEAEQCDKFRGEVEEDLKITSEKLEEIREILSTLNLTDVFRNDIIGSVEDVIKVGTLLGSNTRNDMTLYLSMYFRDKGEEMLVAESKIAEIMDRTLRTRKGFIDSSRAHTLREVAKIVRQTYDKGYTLMGKDVDIKLYEDDVNDILDLKTLPLKQTYLLFLVHTQRVKLREDGTFYFPYSVMNRMGLQSNPTDIKKSILKLEEMGYIEVVEWATRSEGFNHVGQWHGYSNNFYKMKKISNKDADYIQIRDGDIYMTKTEDEENKKRKNRKKNKVLFSLSKILGNFYTLDELKGRLTSTQYSNIKYLIGKDSI